MDGSPQDCFSAMLGGGAAARRTTVVTPATVARVRQEQAADAFAAERAQFAAAQDALRDELDAQRDATEALARDLAVARADLEAAAAARTAVETEAATLRAAIDTARAELEAERAKPRQDEALAAACAEKTAACAAKDEEIERLKAALAEAQRTSLSSAVLLDKPAGLGEKFAGEVREHVLAALADAVAAAESGGRDRRARILEAVLGANPPTGELERRRAAVRQIVKDAGTFLDDTAIRDLETLGFRSITGRNHHKLEWAGIRFPLAKTPGDRRACLNSSAEIANRVF